MNYIILFQPVTFSHKAAPAYSRCNLEPNMSDITCCRVFVFITLRFPPLQMLFTCLVAGCINSMQSCREKGKMHKEGVFCSTPYAPSHHAHMHRNGDPVFLKQFLDTSCEFLELCYRGKLSPNYEERKIMRK